MTARAETLMAELRGAIPGSTREDLARLIGDLEAAKAAAWLEILNHAGSGADFEPMLISVRTPQQDPDMNLSADEAARRLGVSPSFLYKHAEDLPFTVRVGRRVLFGRRKLDEWNRNRMGLTNESRMNTIRHRDE